MTETRSPDAWPPDPWPAQRTHGSTPQEALDYFMHSFAHFSLPRLSVKPEIRRLMALPACAEMLAHYDGPEKSIGFAYRRIMRELAADLDSSTTPSKETIMQGFTTKQAAEIGGCSASHIQSMLAKKQLPGVQKGPHSPWLVQCSRSEIKQKVAEFSPTSGKKRRSNNGAPALTPAHAASDRLEGVPQWVALPNGTRTLLLQIAERFTEGELEVLAQIGT